MNSWIVKLFAPIALKNAIGYTHKLTLLVHAALEGIVEEGNISDVHRANLNTVIAAVAAIRDFTGKLITVFGVSQSTLSTIPSFPLTNSITDSIERLQKATAAI